MRQGNLLAGETPIWRKNKTSKYYHVYVHIINMQFLEMILQHILQLFRHFQCDLLQLFGHFMAQVHQLVV